MGYKLVGLHELKKTKKLERHLSELAANRSLSVPERHQHRLSGTPRRRLV